MKLTPVQYQELADALILQHKGRQKEDILLILAKVIHVEAQKTGGKPNLSIFTLGRVMGLDLAVVQRVDGAARRHAESSSNIDLVGKPPWQGKPRCWVKQIANKNILVTV